MGERRRSTRGCYLSIEGCCLSIGREEGLQEDAVCRGMLSSIGGEKKVDRGCCLSIGEERKIYRGMLSVYRGKRRSVGDAVCL